MKPGLKFSVAAIDSAKEILGALPPALPETKEVSLREAIEELPPPIRGSIGKGYFRQQIVDPIQEQGVGCSLGTLKTYFRPSPEKTKAKSAVGPAAGLTAATRDTSPAAARSVVSRGAGGAEVGTNAAPLDTSTPPAAPASGRGTGSETAGCSAAGRPTAKAS
jgi:hypothetical protein